MAMTFPAHSILTLNGYLVSDHSREPLDVQFEQIETAKRTVSGRMRVYAIAKKYKLSTSWNLLPSRSDLTVDGGLGGKELEELYLNSQEIPVQIWSDAEAASTSQFPRISFDGRISSFNYQIVKRNLGGIFYDFWDLSIEIEEL